MSNHLVLDLTFLALSLCYPLLRHHRSTADMFALHCALKSFPLALLIGYLRWFGAKNLKSAKNSKTNKNNDKNSKNRNRNSKSRSANVVEQSHHPQQQQISQCYLKNILIALALCAIGDAFLVLSEAWKDMLALSIAAFAAAHIIYIRAFGLRPIRASGAAIVGAIFVAALLVLREPLTEMGSIYPYIVPIYIAILLMMGWRALAESDRSAEYRKWRKYGGISFLVSDTVLALTEITGIVPLSPQIATILILGTYYFAQLCFAKTALYATESKIGRRVASKRD